MFLGNVPNGDFSCQLNCLLWTTCPAVLANDSGSDLFRSIEQAKQQLKISGSCGSSARLKIRRDVIY